MFGDMVRAHRGRLGVTQEELADRSGVSVRGLGKIEAGRISRPRPSTVRLLADAFGLSGAERDRFCAAAGPNPAQLRGEWRSGGGGLALPVHGLPSLTPR